MYVHGWLKEARRRKDRHLNLLSIFGIKIKIKIAAP
jgi:hypothetical protein